MLSSSLRSPLFVVLVFAAALHVVSLYYVSSTHEGLVATMVDDFLAMPARSPNSEVTEKAANRFADANIAEVEIGSEFAYAYLVAGCDPPSNAYHGMLFDVLIASHLLQEKNAEGDIVVMVRIAAHSDATRLPVHEEGWLADSGVRLKYLPKAGRDNFLTTTLDKFRILDLTEYVRVLFMDSDAIPLCNIDYWFRESTGPDALLSPNTGFAEIGTPATTSLFMIQPKSGEFDKLMHVVNDTKWRALSDGFFDVVKGWGHEIKEPDYWHRIKGDKGTNWTFFAANSDQGLFYHYIKYMSKNCTLIFEDRIQTWREVPNPTHTNGSLAARAVTCIPLRDDTFIAKVDETKGKLIGCGGPLLDRRKRVPKFRMAPIADYYHFNYKKKPWLSLIDLEKDAPRNLTDAITGRQFWVYYLGEINHKLGMGLGRPINISSWHPHAHWGDDDFKELWLP